MENIDSGHNRRIDRRTVIKRGLVAGGLLAGAGAIARELTDDGDRDSPTPASPAPAVARTAPSARSSKPNILVIVVDQLRFPQWFSPDPAGLGLPPNLQQLRQGAVSFVRHYTASNDCSPARAAMLTGPLHAPDRLHDHRRQHARSRLPHLGDDAARARLPHALARQVAPDPPRQPLERSSAANRRSSATASTAASTPHPTEPPARAGSVDPHIARRFADWFEQEGGAEPWCTTVSFVNPHDIAWWYKWSDRVPAEASAERIVQRLPPNFETPELLLERHKPRLQRSFQDTAAASFGPVPFSGPEATDRWLGFLDLYIKLQLEVDRHIGHVLRALESRPEVAANTVIVFTSDHGEYGASHGLRGKGASAYEESIRVPLIVKDPRGLLTSAPEIPRTQLSSSVDLAPLLLTIGTGSNDWRRDPHYSHIAERLDLAAILADPDRSRTRIRAARHRRDRHRVRGRALRGGRAAAHRRDAHRRRLSSPPTPTGRMKGSTPKSAGQETELYDYSTRNGRLELHNSAGESALEEGLRAEYERAFVEELRQPLPPRLVAAHARGFADYFSTARQASVKAAARRKRRDEREAGGPPEFLPNSPFRPGRRLLTVGEVASTVPAALSACTAT